MNDHLELGRGQNLSFGQLNECSQMEKTINSFFQIYWHKNNFNQYHRTDQQTSLGKILRIDRAQVNDSGLYECRIGVALTQAANLPVNLLPNSLEAPSSGDKLRKIMRLIVNGKCFLRIITNVLSLWLGQFSWGVSLVNWKGKFSSVTSVHKLVVNICNYYVFLIEQ